MAHTERCLWKNTATAYIEVDDQTVDEYGDYSTTAVAALFENGVKYTVRVDPVGYCRCSEDALFRCKETVSTHLFPDHDNMCVYRRKVFEKQTLANGSCEGGGANCTGAASLPTVFFEGTCPLLREGRRPDDFPTECNSGYFGSWWNNVDELQCYFRAKGWDTTGSGDSTSRAAMLANSVSDCINKAVKEYVCSLFPDNPAGDCGWYVSESISNNNKIQAEFRLNRSKHPDKTFDNAALNMTAGGSSPSTPSEVETKKCIHSVQIPTQLMLTVNGGPCWDYSDGEAKNEDVGFCNPICDSWGSRPYSPGSRAEANDNDCRKWYELGGAFSATDWDTTTGFAVGPGLKWKGKGDQYSAELSFNRTPEFKERDRCSSLDERSLEHSSDAAQTNKCPCEDEVCSPKWFLNIVGKYRELPKDFWKCNNYNPAVPGSYAIFGDGRDKVKCYSENSNCTEARVPRTSKIREVSLNLCNPKPKDIKKIEGVIELLEKKIHYIQLVDFKVSIHGSVERQKCCDTGIDANGVDLLLKCKRELMGGRENTGYADALLDVIAPIDDENGMGTINTAPNGTELISTITDDFKEVGKGACAATKSMGESQCYYINAQGQYISPPMETGGGSFWQYAALEKCQHPEQVRKVLLQIIKAAKSMNVRKTRLLAVMDSYELLRPNPAGGQQGSYSKIEKWAPVVHRGTTIGAYAAGAEYWADYDTEGRECIMTAEDILGYFLELAFGQNESSVNMCGEEIEVEP